MSTPTHLSPTQCAEQFEAYAEAAQQACARCCEDESALYHEGKQAGYTHAARFLRDFAVLRWSKELPTKLGHYWVRYIGNTMPDRANTAEVVTHPNGGLYCMMMDMDLTPLEFYIGTYEWAGPIPEPQEPTP